MTSEVARDQSRDIEFTPFASDPDAPALDCETAALMRGWLRPLVEQASGWSSLIEALSTRGYVLIFRQGRLWLMDKGTGRRLCTMRHLGASMRDLASRLGRPSVRPIPGRPSWGELHAPSQR